jgi:trk system potassium uptake protein TrkA
VHLSGNAEIFEVTVGERSRIAGRSLAAADGSDILPDDVRVVAIERNCSVLLPQGETEIRTGDVVTVFSERGFDSEIIDVFVGENAPVSQRKQQT